MKRTIITIILLTLLVIALSSYVVADKVQEKLAEERNNYYNYGFQEGQKGFYNSIIQGLSTEGFITLPVTMQDNTTTNIKIGLIQNEKNE